MPGIQIRKKNAQRLSDTDTGTGLGRKTEEKIGTCIFRKSITVIICAALCLSIPAVSLCAGNSSDSESKSAADQALAGLEAVLSARAQDNATVKALQSVRGKNREEPETAAETEPVTEEERPSADGRSGESEKKDRIKLDLDAADFITSFIADGEPHKPVLKEKPDTVGKITYKKYRMKSDTGSWTEISDAPADPGTLPDAPGARKRDICTGKVTRDGVLHPAP